MAVRFDNNNNYPPITLPPLQTTVEIEEHRKNTTFDQNYNSLLPNIKEIYVNQWYINIFINTLIFSINEGSYTLTGV
ncbi:hypothetical protein JP0533_12670 [Helicobacter pylori]